MGLLDSLKKNGKAPAATSMVCLPLEGEVITLEQIGDGVFSAGILGQGFGIRPQQEVIYAPVDGTVILVADTGHAVGIKTHDGMEVMIHVGLDTVEMNGEGFAVEVKAGDQVKTGQLLYRFDRGKIERAGYADVTAVLITNTSEYSEIELLKTGVGAVGDEILKIVR